MKKIDIANLPKTGWPKIVEDEGKKFYSAQGPDKHIPRDNWQTKSRLWVSPLGGLMKEPTK
jgi:hypothetical protein